MSESPPDPHRWQGLALVDPSGQRVGKVAEVFLDAADDRPAWLVVSSGAGMRRKWVPVVGLRWVDDQLHTAFPLELIRQAPRVDGAPTSNPEGAVTLYNHYGIATAAEPAVDTQRPVPPATGTESDEAMTRSEEALLLRRVVRPAEQVRLVKHVVVEERQLTVRVRRQELRVERIPYGAGEGTDQERHGELADADEAAGEIVLYEEHPVVGTKVVPRERVRLVKSTVTEDRTVNADVRKERIDVETDPLDPQRAEFDRRGRGLGDQRSKE